jgi:hypothetical protein
VATTLNPVLCGRSALPAHSAGAARFAETKARGTRCGPLFYRRFFAGTGLAELCAGSFAARAASTFRR